MITGRIKFLKQSVARFANAGSITADDGTDASVLLNERGEESWVSTVSDGSNVTISVSFGSSFVNRIMIVGHNVRDFTITGEFSGITDINNNTIPDGNIAVTGNTLDTSYFAFDPQPNLSTFDINLGNTIVAGENKTIRRIIVAEEIGTYKGFPVIKQISFNLNSRDVKSKGGPQLITKQRRVLKKIPLQFRNYTQIEDIALTDQLHLSQSPFLIWPCGGDEKQFRYPISGYRLQDIYKVQTKGDFRTSFKDGSYRQLISATINFVEAI